MQLANKFGLGLVSLGASVAATWTVWNHTRCLLGVDAACKPAAPQPVLAPTTNTAPRGNTVFRVIGEFHAETGHRYTLLVNFTRQAPLLEAAHLHLKVAVSGIARSYRQAARVLAFSTSFIFILWPDAPRIRHWPLTVLVPARQYYAVAYASLQIVTRVTSRSDEPPQLPRALLFYAFR